MKSVQLPSAVIFFMTYCYRRGVGDCALVLLLDPLQPEIVFHPSVKLVSVSFGLCRPKAFSFIRRNSVVSDNNLEFRQCHSPTKLETVDEKQTSSENNTRVQSSSLQLGPTVYFNLIWQPTNNPVMTQAAMKAKLM